VGKIRLKNQKKKINRKLFALALVLTILGVVIVADASAPYAANNFSDQYYFTRQQAIWGLLGIVMLFVFSKINYTFYEKIANYLFFASLLLLLIVLLPGTGLRVFGAKRWLNVMGVSIQPSEIMKLSIAVYTAKVASKKKQLLSYLIPLVLVSGLIMLQPDLGTTIVLVFIVFSQMFMAQINILHLLGVGLIGGLISLGLIVISPYRRDRLTTFFESTQDPLGKSYHIRQVLIALGSGGVFGLGLGQSRQKYLFLPEASTDSIFAVVAEEAGFVGGAFLIILFAYFIYLGINIIKHAPDEFSKILATGIVAWIGGQAFVNIASMVALVPLTGIPLPFISYGGSSLTTVLVATGMLLNISRYERKK
jgi:cell division protein FtsW